MVQGDAQIILPFLKGGRMGRDGAVQLDRPGVIALGMMRKRAFQSLEGVRVRGVLRRLRPVVLRHGEALGSGQRL